jgi:hypothetical protein
MLKFLAQSAVRGIFFLPQVVFQIQKADETIDNGELLAHQNNLIKIQDP